MIKKTRRIIYEEIFTSESVTSGHPDKICDAISDAILDEARVRILPARWRGNDDQRQFDFYLWRSEHQADLPFEKIAKEKIREIGYTEEFEVLTKVSKQSAEIYEAVMHDEADMGAGDQGIMFGYACNETENFMPMPIALAHRLAEQLEQVRKQEVHSILKPDGKTQVTVEYDDNKPVRLDTIVVSTRRRSDAGRNPDQDHRRGDQAGDRRQPDRQGTPRSLVNPSDPLSSATIRRQRHDWP